jgi:hypothetical protein
VSSLAPAAFKNAADIGGATDPQLWMARELALLGRSGEGRFALERLRPIGEKRNASPRTMALVYLTLGDIETGLSWLQRR